ncbi:cytochrome c biogenesis protein [Agromyces flavus]|uniref:Cytochrome c biogenesis protein n=1 Tax=Agromyces flavus TaxID=589382 RepID=A0A1H1XXB9_9MICO|nr:cytochrome c biogenesis protein [Agromyces flavus]GGI44848.1 cytochrome c biogenesis protein ResB [Agromyces flavus]SDT13386.1 cytochrome c biogenesis protein [Agromyces flavus]
MASSPRSETRPGRGRADGASARGTGVDPLRPADYDDGTSDAAAATDVGTEGAVAGAGGSAGPLTAPKLGPVGWLRFVWRQLTSMRTALLLLLLLAIAAVPGSLVPQRSSDPNGVVQYFADNPDLAPVLDGFQMFDVYTSVWFSAIYLLLFVSLIGCIIPRTKHHFEALRARPPRTPARLSRLSAYTERPLADDETAEDAIARAAAALKKAGYRVERFDLRGAASVSAERGYLRETGNLVFHTALVGVLVTVAIGGGFGFSGQRVIVEGQSFVNTLAAYDSFNPGRFFDDSRLTPYRLTLDELDAVYETENRDALGQPIDFTARVTIDGEGGSAEREVKVNEPLYEYGTDVYLLGNGYAPTITVRDPDGNVVFTDSIPFLPQDANLTSIGVVKVPDGLDEQLGMVGFFYPTQTTLPSGAYTSSYPDLVYPVLTLNVYSGDLGLDEGTPRSVYQLDTTGMEQLTGGDTGVDSVELMPGETTELPNGLGTVEFETATPDAASDDFSQSVPRFASFDVHHDPSQGWVLVFAVLIIGGLLLSLFVPRRRMWVKAVQRADGTTVLEYAGLARGDDPGLERAVDEFADQHAKPSATGPETSST